jgi:hypothetical protein
MKFTYHRSSGDLEILISEARLYRRGDRCGVIANFEIPDLLDREIAWEHSGLGGRLWSPTGVRPGTSGEKELLAKLVDRLAEKLIDNLHPTFRAWLRQCFADVYELLKAQHSSGVVGHTSAPTALELPLRTEPANSSGEPPAKPPEERRSGKVSRRIADLDIERARRATYRDKGADERDADGGEAVNE